MEIQHKKFCLLLFSVLICIFIKTTTCQENNYNNEIGTPASPIIPKSIDNKAETQQKTFKKDLGKSVRSDKRILKPLAEQINNSKESINTEEVVPENGIGNESNIVQTADNKKDNENSLPLENVIDLPEAYKTGFIYFFGLTITAVFIILLKLYSMRLTRAERKYGVQGNRTTQELTPLPVSIEDGNSDEEDQTLFQINRNIRVL